MGIYVVAFDVRQARHVLEPLYSAMREYSSCMLLEGCWLVESARSAEQIRTHLTAACDFHDMLFVAELQRHWTTTVHGVGARWLKRPERQWSPLPQAQNEY